MTSRLIEIFKDLTLVGKVGKHLPYIRLGNN